MGWLRVLNDRCVSIQRSRDHDGTARLESLFLLLRSTFFFNDIYARYSLALVMGKVAAWLTVYAPRKPRQNRWLAHGLTEQKVRGPRLMHAG